MALNASLKTLLSPVNLTASTTMARLAVSLTNITSHQLNTTTATTTIATTTPATTTATTTIATTMSIASTTLAALSNSTLLPLITSSLPAYLRTSTLFDNITAIPAPLCTSPAYKEFPPDLFTNEQRSHGAMVLHFIMGLYMFYALSIVCDEYFVTSLEKICQTLGFGEDVAGATFMAAGSSAPELFTSIIGVFVTKGDVGFGTIVGSAVFNILFVIGICGLVTAQAVSLSWWPLCRDSIYYSFAVVVLVLVVLDSVVTWYESIIMLIMYAAYIVLMRYNSSVLSYVSSKLRRGESTELLHKGGTAMTRLGKGFGDYGLQHVKRTQNRWNNSGEQCPPLVTLIGYTLKIPDSVMGITFLAAGTSIPDALASVYVVKQGMGDMAVSNSIGSNVFDILLGLALPWFIQTAMVEPGSYVHINSNGMVYSVLLLFLTVLATVGAIRKAGWYLNRYVGVSCLISYAIYLMLSVLIECNFLGFVNLPMCTE
ncbi:sodium/potassium/calcium exchanger 4-like [Argonauta hians]